MARLDAADSAPPASTRMTMAPAPALRAAAGARRSPAPAYPAGTGPAALGLSRLKQTWAESSTPASITRCSAARVAQRGDADEARSCPPDAAYPGRHDLLEHLPGVEPSAIAGSNHVVELEQIHPVQAAGA